MREITAEDESSGVSMGRPRRPPSSPFSPMNIVAGVSHALKSPPPYSMLPEEPLKLSILKLDGSSFALEVSKSSTVADLKMAVQAAFSHETVSWPHLWGHFCLCYEGQKLVEDTDYLKYFSIKDGDQLRFVRHVSISYNLIDEKTKKSVVPSKQLYLSLSRSSSKQPRKVELDANDHQMERNGRNRHQKNKAQIVQNSVVHQNCEPGLLWKGLTSYSKMPTWRRTECRGGDIVCPSRPRSRFSDNFKKLFHSFLR